MAKRKMYLGQHEYIEFGHVVTRRDGIIHNLDGPAVITPDGKEFYFLNGEMITKEKWDEGNEHYTSWAKRLESKEFPKYLTGRYHSAVAPALKNAYFFNGEYLGKAEWEDKVAELRDPNESLFSRFVRYIKDFVC